MKKTIWLISFVVLLFVFVGCTSPISQEKPSVNEYPEEPIPPSPPPSDIDYCSLLPKEKVQEIIGATITRVRTGPGDRYCTYYANLKRRPTAAEEEIGVFGFKEDSSTFDEVRVEEEQNQRESARLSNKEYESDANFIELPEVADRNFYLGVAAYYPYPKLVWVKNGKVFSLWLNEGIYGVGEGKYSTESAQREVIIKLANEVNKNFG